MMIRDHKELSWFHSIDIGNGVVTQGFKSIEALKGHFNMFEFTAENLRGRRVLDIGCNDGYMALECARLGGDVVAIDGVFRDTTKYVLDHAETKFRFYCIDFMSHSFFELGRFDVILCLGVLYHTLYPLEQIQRLAMASKDGALLHLHINYYNLPGSEDAATLFYDYRQQLTPDGTAPVFPSIPWVMTTLRHAGFDDVMEIARGPLGAPLPGGLDPDSRYSGNISLRATYRSKPSSPYLFAYDQTSG
jgi:tRNA (mo5U34)-methyltransferase